MTLAQFCASLLYIASWELPIPEFYRHWLSRKMLMKVLRGLDT